MIEQENPKEITLRVSKDTPMKKLASAIAKELDKWHGEKTIVVRAIGVMAVNQAVKAIARASGDVGQRGKQLLVKIGFDNVTVETVEDPEKSISCMCFYCTVA